MFVVNQVFTHQGFVDYLKSISIPLWAKFIVVHNTSEPDVALYQKWVQRGNPTPDQWLKNLTSFYAGKGWSGGPHLFIPPTPDTILVMNDLRRPGVHTPSWNRFSIGVETVGEFEREQFAGTPTEDNLVFALARLHEKLGINPLPYSLGESGLHFHKEDKATTHRTCPGHNMDKASLVSNVVKAMGGTVSEPEQPVDTHLHVPIASQEADTHGMSVQELTSMKWLQTMLNRWKPGLSLTVDGVRGPRTDEAVRTFQQDQGLTVDGIAGPG